MSIFLYALIGIVLALVGTGYYHEILKEVEWKPSTFSGLNGVASVHIGHYKDTIKIIKSVVSAATNDQLIDNKGTYIAFVL